MFSYFKLMFFKTLNVNHIFRDNQGVALLAAKLMFLFA